MLLSLGKWLSPLTPEKGDTMYRGRRDLKNIMKIDLVAMSRITSIMGPTTDVSIKKFAVEVMQFFRTEYNLAKTNKKYGEFTVDFHDEHHPDDVTITYMIIELYLGKVSIYLTMKATTECDYARYVSTIQTMMYSMWITIMVATCGDELNGVRIASFPDVLEEITPCSFKGELYSADIKEPTKVAVLGITGIPDVLRIN